MIKKPPLILVIDDEESMRDSCQLIIKKDGYRSDTAAEGLSGLKKVEENKPDIVLIDLKMPGINGLDVLEKVIEINPKIIPIVITGYATVESAVEAMKKGAYDFLPKPFTPGELRIIIKRALERRKLILETEALREEKRLIEENFITMVTHQLRSPLTVILQYFETILSGLVPDPEQQKEMMSKAKARLEDLMELINDWLDLSRMNRGILVEKFKPFSLSSLLKGLLEFYEPKAKEEKIALEMSSSFSDVIIQGDEETLEQAFSNIISNAIQYNKPGGTVKVTFMDEGDAWSVSVKDTGIGIPKENLPLIFDQFYRVKSKKSLRQKGTGLGLSIAKKIVEAHDGSISVFSKENSGSVFTVILPKEKKK